MRICLTASLALALSGLLPLARASAEEAPKPARIDELLASREAFFQPKMGDQVPGDLVFKDETGKVVRLGDYYGDKPIILVPAYYLCRHTCPLMLHDLTRRLRSIPFRAGTDFQVVVVGFDPREGPDVAAAKKKATLEEYGFPGTENGWHFLTGQKEPIQRLLDAVGFQVQYDADKDQYVHARGLLILSPDGKVARYLLGGDYPPRNLRLGLVEAGEGRIASAPDQILLMCFIYDPSMGRYSASVLGIMKLGAIFTILGVGSFIAISLWRDPSRLARKTSLAAATPTSVGAAGGQGDGVVSAEVIGRTRDSHDRGRE